MTSRETLFDDLDRKARDAYALAGSYGNGPRASYWLGFCQKVVKACADGRRLERERDRLRSALVAAQTVIDAKTFPQTAEMIEKALR